MDELLLKYDKLIYMMANKYKSYASIDDLYQAGCIGLIKAIDNFDINQDVQFSTYRSTYDNWRSKKIFKRQ